MASNLRVDTILPSTGTNVAIGTASGSVPFLGDTDITTSGSVSIGGTLTYEDVTNVDSVGVITARSGIRIGATGANTLITGNGTGIGIGITTPTEELHIRATTPVIRLEDGDNARQSQIVGSDGNLRLDADNNNAIADTNIAFRTDGGERLRIGPVGQIGIGGANYGTSGQVLTSQGSGSAVQWATPSGGGLSMADQWRLTSGQTIAAQDVLLTAWERPDTSGTGGGAYVGGGMSNSSGTFSFPTTGIYLITFEACANGTNNTRYSEIDIVVTKNNSSYVEVSRSFFYYNRPTGTSTGASCSCSFIMDVDNISNDKVRFESSQDNVGQHQILGDSGVNMTVVTFLRLGDT